jgi:ketosteroid isomerase-like protein
MKKILMLTAVVFAASTLRLPAQANRQATAPHASLTNAEQALANLEQGWATAVKQRDVGKIDQLQAEEYTFTDPAGRIWTKARALDSMRSGDLEIDSFELSDVQVKIYGKTAVVTFAIMWNGNFRGNDISGPQRMTDVFVKRAGRWQCVASQATRIRTP